MSTQTRTKMVEQEVKVKVCDGCGRDIAAVGWQVATFRKPYAFDDCHFCSYDCLGKWAAEQAAEQEQEQARKRDA